MSRVVIQKCGSYEQELLLILKARGCTVWIGGSSGVFQK